MPKRFEDTDELAGAEFRNVRMPRIRIDGADLSEASLRNVNLEGAVIKEAYLVGATIEGDLTGVRINGLDFGQMYTREMLRLYPERRRLRASTPEGFRDALALIDEMRAETVGRAERMSEEQRQQRTPDGEWSVVENLRHLLFSESSWALRTAFGESDPFHPLGQPPDFAVEGAKAVGIRVGAEASFEDTVGALERQHARVRSRFDRLTQDELDAPCGDRGPGYPGAYGGTVAAALLVCLHHEWDHHKIIERVIEEVT